MPPKNKLYTEADLVKLREANPTLYQNGIGANAKQRLEEDAARFAEELDRSAVDAKRIAARIFGSCGPPLCYIGAKPLDLVITAGKLSRLMKEHPEV